MTRLVWDGKERKNSRYFIYCRCSTSTVDLVHSHWLGLPKQTGSSGQCFTVIGCFSLICDSDKERRKATCGQGDMQISRERAYVCDSMLII